MKIAFCFGGLMRTAEYAADNILNYIGDLLPKIDFFVHTWDENDFRRRASTSLKIKEYCEANSLPQGERLSMDVLLPYKGEDVYSLLPKVIKKYDNRFRTIEVEKFQGFYKNFWELYPTFSPQFYSWYKVNLAKKREEDIYNFKYDFVIKTRFDMMFPPEASLAKEIEHCQATGDCFYALSYRASAMKMNDVFFISSSDVMDRASEFGLKAPQKKQYPTIFYDYLTSRNINIAHTNLKNFSLYRPESIPHSSLDFQKIYNDDKEWYWNS